MVFQNPDAQLFCSTVEREIAYGLESLGLERTVIRRRIGETAERLAVTRLLARAPHELSGGEKHLITLAAIIALAPAVLVLDEPFANLDGRHVQRIRAIIRSVHAAGTGIVICEHRLAPTLPEVARMVVLRDGRVVANGPRDDVLQNDLEAWGLETPLPAVLGKRHGLRPLPLTVDALPSGIGPAGDAKAHPAADRPALAGPPVLEVEGLHAARGRRMLLEDITFTAHAGECLAVVGANGAGKTTLLRHLVGLARPSAGTVRIEGRPIRGRRVARVAAHVGLAFQNPDNQFFKLTVREEIEAGPRALRRFDPDWIHELVARFSLAPYLDRAPYRLSGGEKKRVAFAAALAARPSILALDEPTAGQDYHFRRTLAGLLAELRREGLLVILVTHDLAFAEECAGRWILMNGGRIVADGRPRKVMADAEVMDRTGLTPTDRFRLNARIQPEAGDV
jgi:energy-coupling factor transport system ATP-binding protein